MLAHSTSCDEEGHKRVQGRMCNPAVLCTQNSQIIGGLFRKADPKGKIGLNARPKRPSNQNLVQSAELGLPQSPVLQDVMCELLRGRIVPEVLLRYHHWTRVGKKCQHILLKTALPTCRYSALSLHGKEKNMLSLLTLMLNKIAQRPNAEGNEGFLPLLGIISTI